MFKNQLQELAQRSCFNLPSYACIREGPDHAPRFKASVNFNGEIFESPSYCPTLRQAEHAAAEAALNILSSRGPSRSLTARVLDETGVYKNLLQETAHRAGLNLPVYTTVRSGPGHVPIFTCTVELAGMSFTGEPAKTKKQAEKNAAIAAWSALKRMPNLDSLTSKEADNNNNREDQDQAVVSRVLSSLKPKEYESKQFRRREYYNNQAKRRMVRGNNNSRDIGSASSSSTSAASNSLLHQQLRLMDILMDSSAMDGSTQKQNSFVSLLPPPPPRTASKILPPPTTSSSSNRPIPVQMKGKSEHLKDDQVLNKSIEKEGSSSSSNVHGASTTSSSIYRPVPTPPPTITEASQIISRLLGSQAPTSSTMASKNMMMCSGGSRFNYNPNRIAPAVTIRSVIPVCAAPPPPSSNRPTQEATPSSSSSSGQDQQLSSELVKKLQL